MKFFRHIQKKEENIHFSPVWSKRQSVLEACMQSLKGVHCCIMFYCKMTDSCSTRL